MGFLLQTVFRISGNELTLPELIIASAIVLVSIGILLYLNHLLRILASKNAISINQRNFLFTLAAWIVSVTSFLLILNTFDINLNRFWKDSQTVMDYTLYGKGEKTVKVLNVVIALSIAFGAWFVLRWMRRILALARHRKRLTVGQEFAYMQVTRYFVFFLTLALVLYTFHIKITALILGSTALLIGIGLGLQQVFVDFVSGFFLLMERSVRVNDIIEISNFVCKVKEIGVRTSKVVTRDGIIVVVPNSKIISDNVINWSMNGTTTRFTLSVRVAYGSDTQKVKKVLLDCAVRHQEVSKNPKPICRLTDFGESALKFDLLFFSKSRFRIEEVLSDLRFMIDSEFRKNNIRIPFPQHDIHLRSDLTKKDIRDEKGFSL